MDYKLDKIIHYGANAANYKVKINKKYYAIRRQKISDSDANIIKNIDFNNLSNIYNNVNIRLIKFIYVGLVMNKINKDHFLNIYNINLIEEKKYMIPRMDRHEDWYLKNYEEMKTFNYCFDIITELKDGNFFMIRDKLNKKQLYSAIIQIIYALYLMHSNDFYHDDIHEANICFIKTNIKNLNIPTYGYIFTIIDYEGVHSYKFNDSYYNLTVKFNKFWATMQLYKNRIFLYKYIDIFIKKYSFIHLFIFIFSHSI